MNNISFASRCDRINCFPPAKSPVLGFVLAWLFALVQPGGAALPPDLKIWPLGDSITYGSFGSNGGFRGGLYTLLTASVASNFVFVGSSTQNGGISTLPADQRRNEGHESYACGNIFTNLDGVEDSLFVKYGGASRNPNGGHWLTGIDSGDNARPALFPDVILLLTGANDRDQTNGAVERLDSLVAKLVTMRPNARLILARIPPILDSRSHSNFVVNFNHGVDQVAAKYAVSNRVTEVDLNTDFPADGFSRDRLHPNNKGYDWMAAQWQAAIVAAFEPKSPAKGGN